MNRFLVAIPVLCVLLATWNPTFSSPVADHETIVAVVDSGVDARHPELVGKLVAGFDLTADQDPLIDRVGHGTAMASLIAGQTLGSCNHCRIMPVKVTNSMDVDLDTLSAAIDIAVREGASVIYVGAGATGSNQLLDGAVSNAHAAGVTIVAPAGTQLGSFPLYPAAYPSVITVAALTQSGQLFRTSNDPGEYALYAIGENVTAANASGGYIRVNGSSPAAAHVAGELGNTATLRATDDFAAHDAVNRDNTSSMLHSGNTLMATLQYGDTDDTDIIFDAPWRTIRNYLPVLVLVPEFEQDPPVSRVLVSIELFNYDRAAKRETNLIFTDKPAGPDTVNCNGQDIGIIDPDGHARGPIGDNEVIDKFWHYVLRVPVGCIGGGAQAGQAGAHYLLARARWMTIRVDGTSKSIVRQFSIDRVLRVLLRSEGFPHFDPADHYYDAHVHTIAEQTGWHGTRNVDAPRKAFGGPLAMLVESAYALGMIETQLNNGNWKSFRDQLATTDHNVFFSGNPYDAGTHPGHGPTSKTNGKNGEFEWYRDNFGELSGEELTLWGTGRNLYVSDMSKSMGSHFLVYGAPHFEGPWHGGNFTVSEDDILGVDVTTLTDLVGTDNPNRMENVLKRLHHTDAFGYAAHPFDKSIGWAKEYFDRAIGLPPYNDGADSSQLLQKDATDFLFKGSQVWNEKNEFKSGAQLEGRSLKVSELSHLDPFTPRDSKQVFQANLNWEKDLDGALAEFVVFLKQGLAYSFKQQPDHRFIRKLYMSAGTDAHGDFNYLSGLRSTTEAEIHDAWGGTAESATISSNAFGRVRTYTLTGEKMGRVNRGPVAEGDFAATANQVAVDDSRPGAGKSITAKTLRTSALAYREGNTILTDGPICRFNVDSECRFDSDDDKLAWHDGQCRWENADGFIGGQGNFDGGGTVLIARNSTVMLNTQWDGKNDYIPAVEPQPDTAEFTFDAYSSGAGGHFVMDSGPRGAVRFVELPQTVTKAITERSDFSPSALMMSATLGSPEARSRCMTNPVWVVPAKVYLAAPPQGCPIKPGELKVSISFGVSMDTSLGERCAGGDCMAPTNPSHAAYSGPSIRVYPLDGAGKSTGPGIRLTRQWFPNNLAGPGFRKIENANLVAENSTEIACPPGDWDADSHSNRRNASSYVVVASDLHDMHGNQLNTIGDTFSITTTRTRPNPRTTAPTTGRAITPRASARSATASCNTEDAKLCTSYSASCDVVKTKTGTATDLCRWESRRSAIACKSTAGIWTAAASTYAKNHPGAVEPGASGACITEAKNLKKRIQ